MAVMYETSEIRRNQVDLAAIGAEIFSTAAAAISASEEPGYIHKPLSSIVLCFERACLDQNVIDATGQDDATIERLLVSITRPERVDEYSYSRKDKDIFLFPSLSEQVKNTITKQIGIASDKVIAGDTDPRYYLVPPCAVTTSYALVHGTKRLVIDTNVYLPSSSSLVMQGRQFASTVVEYIRTKLYRDYPYKIPKDEGAFAAALGGITHTSGVRFSTRPPVNGRETKEWLEEYAAWLRQSIQEMTFGPEDPKTIEEFKTIGDMAMNDGILLMQTMDAISRAE